MSFSYMALVYAHGPSELRMFSVLLALADQARDANGGVCSPSRALLCQRSRMSSATVSRALNDLCEAGWLQRRKRFQSSSVFRINLARLRRLQADAGAAAVVPDGFDAFPEEGGVSAQAVEIADNAHCEHNAASVACDNAHSEHNADHSEHNADHSEHLTYIRPIKDLCAGARAGLPVADKRPRGRADVYLKPGEMLAYLDTHLPYEAHSAWLARQSGPCASGAGTVPGSTGAERSVGGLC